MTLALFAPTLKWVLTILNSLWKCFEKVQLLGKWRWRRERCNNIKNRIHGTERENSQQKSERQRKDTKLRVFIMEASEVLATPWSGRKNRWSGVLWKIIMNGAFKCFIFPHVFLRKALFLIPPVAGKKFERKTLLLSLKFLFYFLINVLRVEAIAGACYRHLLLFGVCWDARELQSRFWGLTWVLHLLHLVNPRESNKIYE